MFNSDTIPPGITVGVQPDGQRVDLSAFKAAAHYSARIAGGSVVRFDFDRPYTSYVHAVLDQPGGAVTVLCNRAYPAVAFSNETESVYMTHPFVEAPTLSAAFSDSSFQTVPLSVLTAPPADISLGALSESERKTVRYWIKYGRLHQAGDLIFNNWD
ncbi:hypothetical protein [Rubrivirga sp.]|uniref:hypothetical protein n=1 Tax=Rubrivirga sp. TaxID=1885344 RepID=UPI003C765595